MRILAHRALRGPNFYARFPVTYMLLDIGELEERPSDLIPGLADRIKAALPSLIHHRCSPGRKGGFFERLERGTWAGHIVEHIALELQSLAGMDVGFGKTRETTERGVYSVVYRHRDEECGLVAGERAIELLDALIHERATDVPAIIQELKETRERNLFGPSTASMVDAARARDIPVLRVNSQSHVMLGQGIHQKAIQASMTSETTALGVQIAADKEWTKRLLADAGIAVPAGHKTTTLEQAKLIAKKIGYPVVVKPLDANHGRGITTDIPDESELETAFEAARVHHDVVIVEKFLVGFDHRILLIDGKMVAAARRDPAHVVGDGTHTVRELIAIVNSDPRRGFGHEKVLTQIHINANTERMLKVQEIGLDDVPEAGRQVILKSTANLSTGGTATDVTDEVQPALRFMAERVARIVGLDIMGIDVVAPHLRLPLEETGGGIVEVNAGPGLRMHLEPAEGTPRPVGEMIVDMMFPDGSNGRIPIVAVTGTNGKTTTVRLVAHLLKYGGARVGLASTGSVEVENQVILRGDYSGPTGAQTVLQEPTVTHAVIEVARGGILRRGMGVDRVDVGILLNVGRDHIGEGDIHDLEDLLRLKATVPDAAETAVLNADDELVLSLHTSGKLPGNIILFSLDSSHPALSEHLAADATNVVVTVHNEAIVLRKGTTEFHVADLQDIPLTMNGKARFNVQNAMAATAAGYAIGLTEDDVRTGLRTFHSTPGQNPGRMNTFDVAGTRVLLDFGHNVPAIEALDEVIPHLIPRPGGRVLRVAYLAGNRLDDDLRQVGAALATHCHELWVSDPDPRGRKEGGASKLIAEGAIAAGLDATRVHSRIDEWANILECFDAAQPGDLLVFQCEAHDQLMTEIRRRQDAARRVLA